MKRFRFRLEQVLRIRAFELERARVALEAVLVEHRRRQMRVDEVRRSLAEGRLLMDQEIRQGADGDRLALRSTGLAVGRLQVAQAETAISELEPTLNEARRLVTHRRTRLRSLERLREGAQQEYGREAQRVEQAELEEVARSRQAPTRRQASLATQGGAP